MMELVVAVTVGLVLAIALILASAAGAAATRVVVRAFTCPYRGQHVSAEFVEELRTGRLVDVLTCTAYSPPGVIDCAKPCLRLRRLG